MSDQYKFEDSGVFWYMIFEVDIDLFLSRELGLKDGGSEEADGHLS